MKLIAAFAAAAAILKAASDEVAKFVKVNTPESALLAALVTDYTAYSTGQLPGSAAALMAFGAFMTFAVAESVKDTKAP